MFKDTSCIEEIKVVFSSADLKVSSAELMVLLICRLSVRRLSVRPFVNIFFKLHLLLLAFLFYFVLFGAFTQVDSGFFSLLFHCWFAQYMIKVLGTRSSLLLGSRFLMFCQKLVHLAQGTIGASRLGLRFCCTAAFAGVSCFAFDV